MIFNIDVAQLKRVSVFLKCNDNNMYIVSFNISEQIINRRQLNKNLKRKAFDDMFIRSLKIIRS